jgi:bacterioferritin-associated ferredoxin
MIICLCRAKNDRDVLAAIEEGAESVADLQSCGIGTECRSCHNFLRKMIAEQQSLLENCAIISSHAGEQEDHRHPQ